MKPPAPSCVPSDLLRTPNQLGHGFPHIGHTTQFNCLYHQVSVTSTFHACLRNRVHFILPFMWGCTLVSTVCCHHPLGMTVTVTTKLKGGSDGKESVCNVGYLGLIPGLGRSPGGGHGEPLQYSCLENPHGHRSLVGYGPWGSKETDTTERLSTQHKGKQSVFRYVFIPKAFLQSCRLSKSSL